MKFTHGVPPEPVPIAKIVACTRVDGENFFSSAVSQAELVFPLIGCGSEFALCAIQAVDPGLQVISAIAENASAFMDQ